MVQLRKRGKRFASDPSCNVPLPVCPSAPPVTCAHSIISPLSLFLSPHCIILWFLQALNGECQNLERLQGRSVRETSWVPAPTANAPCKGDTAEEDEEDSSPGTARPSWQLTGAAAGARSARGGEEDGRDETWQAPAQLLSVPSSATNSWHRPPTCFSSTRHECPSRNEHPQMATSHGETLTRRFPTLFLCFPLPTSLPWIHRLPAA